MKGSRIKSEHHPLSTSLHQNSNNRTLVCRSEVKMMYSAFQFQFSESYCKPACPKEPEVSASEYRGVSPIPSDYGLSDRGKRHRRSSDKISLSSSEKLDKKPRKTSAKSLSRKNSTVSTLSLKSQQTLVDCSSTESVNSSLKNPRKLNTFKTTDSYEVLDKRSKVDKNGKLRSGSCHLRQKITWS